MIADCFALYRVSFRFCLSEFASVSFALKSCAIDSLSVRFRCHPDLFHLPIVPRDRFAPIPPFLVWCLPSVLVFGQQLSISLI